jgi:hypothetical protein
VARGIRVATDPTTSTATARLARATSPLEPAAETYEKLRRDEIADAWLSYRSDVRPPSRHCPTSNIEVVAQLGIEVFASRVALIGTCK